MASVGIRTKDFASRKIDLFLPGLVGFTSFTGQVLLMRELIVLFNGNEISVGMMLAVWLAWTSAGALLGNHLTRSEAGTRIWAGILTCLSGSALPLTICYLRNAKRIFTPVPTELLGPVPMMLVCVLYLSVFCLMSGTLFALAAKLGAHSSGISQQSSFSRAYAMEAAGGALGALCSGLLLWICTDLQIACLAALVGLLAGALVAFRMVGKPAIAAAVLACLAAIPITRSIAPRLDVALERRLWATMGSSESRDSLYGRIAVVKTSGIGSIYQDGSILANLPDPAVAEEAVHPALLEQGSPRTVLMIGGGFNGSLAEALTYPTLQRLDYVELDPALVSMVRKNFPQVFTQFSDPRIHLAVNDGRRFLQQSNTKYDAILVNTPEPETAQWNRFYSVEFFRIAREHLAPGGIVALQLASAPEFISPDRADFLRCLFRTLNVVFPQIAVIPGDPVHLIASASSNTLTEDSGELLARAQRLGIQPVYFGIDYLPFRMSAERMVQARSLLQPVRNTPVNSDLRPVAYYFSSVLWSSEFGHAYAAFLRAVSNIPFVWIVMALGTLAICAGATGWIPLSVETHERCAAALSVLTSGYSLMMLQVLLLFSIQCLYGYVYTALSLIVGMFMAGMGTGTYLAWTDSRSSSAQEVLHLATWNQSIASLMPVITMMGIGAIATVDDSAVGNWAALVCFACIAFLCSVPAGMQFPFAAAIHAASQPKGSAAVLYSLDLLGGCAGALVVSGILVPLYGLWNTAWTAVLLGLPAAVLLLRTSRLSAKSRGHARQTRAL